MCEVQRCMNSTICNTQRRHSGLTLTGDGGINMQGRSRALSTGKSLERETPWWFSIDIKCFHGENLSTISYSYILQLMRKLRQGNENQRQGRSYTRKRWHSAILFYIWYVIKTTKHIIKHIKHKTYHKTLNISQDKGCGLVGTCHVRKWTWIQSHRTHMRSCLWLWYWGWRTSGEGRQADYRSSMVQWKILSQKSKTEGWRKGSVVKSTCVQSSRRPGFDLLIHMAEPTCESFPPTSILTPRYTHIINTQ